MSLFPYVEYVEKHKNPQDVLCLHLNNEKYEESDDVTSDMDEQVRGNIIVDFDVYDNIKLIEIIGAKKIFVNPKDVFDCNNIAQISDDKVIQLYLFSEWSGEVIKTDCDDVYLLQSAVSFTKHAGLGVAISKIY